MRLILAIKKYNWSQWSYGIGLTFLWLILISNLLLPEQWGISRLENIFFPFAIISVFTLDKFRVDKTILYALFGLFLCSLLSNISNLQGTTSFMHSFRYLKYVFIYLIISHASQINEKSIRRSFDIIIVALIFVNIIQVIDPQDWGLELLKQYSNHEQNYELNQTLNRKFRLFGTQNNPNNNALLWSIICAYYFARNLTKIEIWNILIISLSLVFIVLTQSRTSLIALIIAFSTYYSIRHFKMKTFLIIGSGLLFVSLLIQFSGLSYMRQIVENNPLKISSFTQRYEAWGLMLEVWKLNPFVGIGFGVNFESTIGKAPDSELFYYLASGGALFILVYFSLFIATLTKGIQMIKKHPYYSLMIILPLIMLINGLTNYSFNNIKGATLFVILLAIINSIPKEREENFNTIGD